MGALGLDRLRRRGRHRRLPGVPEDRGDGCGHANRCRRERAGGVPLPTAPCRAAPAAPAGPADPRGRHPLRGPQRVVRRERLAGRLDERAAGRSALSGRQPLVGRDHLARHPRLACPGAEHRDAAAGAARPGAAPPRGNHPPDGRPGAAAPPLASAG
jgi:hypothetical protein